MAVQGLALRLGCWGLQPALGGPVPRAAPAGAQAARGGAAETLPPGRPHPATSAQDRGAPGPQWRWGRPSGHVEAGGRVSEALWPVGPPGRAPSFLGVVSLSPRRDDLPEGLGPAGAAPVPFARPSPGARPRRGGTPGCGRGGGGRPSGVGSPGDAWSHRVCPFLQGEPGPAGLPGAPVSAPLWWGRGAWPGQGGH